MGILIGIWGLVTIGVLLIYLRTKKVKNVYAGNILGMLSFLVIPLAILEFIYLDYYLIAVSAFVLIFFGYILNHYFYILRNEVK